MSLFNHLPERLEVSDGGYTSIMWTIEINYWKYDNLSFIYALVFQLEVWVLISIAICFSSLYYLFQSKWHGFYPTDSKNISNQCINAFVTHGRALLTMDLDGLHQRFLSIRLHLLAIGLCGAILFWSYSGLLVSYFTAESENPPINSLEDLVNVPDLRILVIKDTASHQTLLRALQSRPDLEQIISKNIIVFEMDRYHQLHEEFKKSIKESTTAIIFWTYEYLLMEYKNDPNLCQLRHARLSGVSTRDHVGWLYPKNSILRKIIDHYMLQLAEEGMERQIYDKYFGQLFNPQCQTSSFAPLGFEIVLTLFQMLVTGCGVAMLCMLSELMVDKFIN